MGFYLCAGEVATSSINPQFLEDKYATKDIGCGSFCDGVFGCVRTNRDAQ